jgi:hypothetical protein
MTVKIILPVILGVILLLNLFGVNMIGGLTATLGNLLKLPEYGISEKLSGGWNQQTQPWVGQVHAGAQVPGGYIKPTFGVDPYTSNNQPVRSSQQNILRPNQTQPTPPPSNQLMDTGGGGGGTNTPNAPTNVFQADPEAMRRQMLQAAQARWQAGMGLANDAWSAAQQRADSARGLLGERRGQFGEQLETGKQDIFDDFNRGRQDLSQTAQGAATRMGNALRAMGMGGSAMVNTQGRQQQEQAQALGSLARDKSLNERQNQELFNERDLWARGEESNIENYLRDAQNQKSAAERFGYADYTDDLAGIDSNMFNLISQIQQRQQDIDAARQGIGAYEANPFGVNMGNYAGLLNSAAPMQLPQGGVDEGVNMNAQSPFQELLKNRG